ncbi:hypothetical protein FCM35_KLT01515 [Carex littledalei]|uniref:Uncharacterized protein n=1 Tax=Carex littledalei TaxID=544730 RepID=A0A833VU90_9POAL|nr:hypothetical protein FCM35_KLT01515 [Carex littledalei]
MRDHRPLRTSAVPRHRASSREVPLTLSRHRPGYRPYIRHREGLRHQILARRSDLLKDPTAMSKIIAIASAAKAKCACYKISRVLSSFEQGGDLFMDLTAVKSVLSRRPRGRRR